MVPQKQTAPAVYYSSSIKGRHLAVRAVDLIDDARAFVKLRQNPTVFSSLHFEISELLRLSGLTETKRKVCLTRLSHGPVLHSHFDTAGTRNESPRFRSIAVGCSRRNAHETRVRTAATFWIRSRT
jgi:hypothetical protein